MISRRGQFEIIRTAVILPILRGGGSHVELATCLECGALVGDPQTHVNWHQATDPKS